MGQLLTVRLFSAHKGITVSDLFYKTRLTGNQILSSNKFVVVWFSLFCMIDPERFTQEYLIYVAFVTHRLLSKYVYLRCVNMAYSMYSILTYMVCQHTFFAIYLSI